VEIVIEGKVYKGDSLGSEWRPAADSRRQRLIGWRRRRRRRRRRCRVAAAAAAASLGAAAASAGQSFSQRRSSAPATTEPRSILQRLIGHQAPTDKHRVLELAPRSAPLSRSAGRRMSTLPRRHGHRSD